MPRGRNKTQRVPDVRQASLLDVGSTEAPPRRRVVGGVMFDCGERERLFVGQVSLKEYLEREGLRWVLKLSKVLDGLDWSAFEAAYAGGGRPGLHPKVMVGLIMYGLLLKQASLRQLEALARRDLGAWWITGGLTPDHSSFTRFLGRHESLLAEDFFVQLTASIVKELGLTTTGLVLDGTVIQAVASNVSALKREALETKLEEAERSEPQRVEQLKAAKEVLDERAAERAAAGKDTATAVVSATEPEAVMQPKKNSEDYGFAYKPVIGVHPSGLIIGQALSPTSETECVPEILTQHGQIMGAAPERALGDAGFNSIDVLGLFWALQVDALVPAGGDALKRKGAHGRYPKSAFLYDEATDSMTCPAGQHMRPHSPQADRTGRSYREFVTPACASCLSRTKCTTAEERRIKRYDGDELKDAMALVLTQPRAREAYAQRAAIVEPAIARLRQNGLNRFTRRGRRKARLEFALRCAAHNLGLLLWRRKGVLVVILLHSHHGSLWRPFAVAIVLTGP